MIPVLPECKQPAQQFCGDCRNLEKGRGFRTAILKIRGVEHETDFECPLSKPWSHEPQQTSLVGQVFHKLLVEKYSIPACSRCVELMNKMNAMGPEKCIEQKTEILEDIWTRRDKLEGWRGLAARLPGAKHLAFFELGSILDKAIEATKATA